MGKELKSFEEILDPNFINADLLGSVGSEKVVTITKFEEMEYYDNATRKKQLGSAVCFKEVLPLILNKTNTKTLKKLFSPNTDDTSNCIGHQVILYVTTTKVAGIERNCIRIKEYSEQKCDECKKVIVPYSGKTVAELVDISNRNFGKCLCGACMSKKAKENKDDK